MKKSYNRLNKRLRIIFLVAIPFILVIFLFVLFRKKDFYLFPNEKFRNSYYIDTEANHGNSEVKFYEATNSFIEFRYALHNRNPNPFTGVAFDFMKHTDLQGYDRLDLSLELTNNHSLKLYIVVNKEGFTQTNNYMSHVFFEHDIYLSEGKNDTSVRLEEFIPAQWWRTMHNVVEIKKMNPDFSQTAYLDIESGIKTPMDEETGLIIRKVVFRQEPALLCLRIGVLTAVYYLLFFGVRFVLGKRKFVTVPYQKVELKNTSETEQERIVSFIAVHYNDQELSLEKIGRELGIHPVKIGAVINSAYGLSFKQYLNHIRMTEAKRLITETDRQFTDIAYAVGFGNVTHFNRVFRKTENRSPSDYRKDFKN